MLALKFQGYSRDKNNVCRPHMIGKYLRPAVDGLPLNSIAVCVLFSCLTCLFFSVILMCNFIIQSSFLMICLTHGRISIFHTHNLRKIYRIISNLSINILVSPVQSCQRRFHSIFNYYFYCIIRLSRTFSVPSVRVSAIHYTTFHFPPYVTISTKISPASYIPVKKVEV